MIIMIVNDHYVHPKLMFNLTVEGITYSVPVERITDIGTPVEMRELK